jgi:hypothetical protein
LLKKLKETEGEATFGELNDYIKKNVLNSSWYENGKAQTPTVTFSSSLSDQWQEMKLK